MSSRRGWSDTHRSVVKLTKGSDPFVNLTLTNTLFGLRERACREILGIESSRLTLIASVFSLPEGHTEKRWLRGAKRRARDLFSVVKKRSLPASPTLRFASRNLRFSVCPSDRLKTLSMKGRLGRLCCSIPSKRLFGFELKQPRPTLSGHGVPKDR